MDVDVVIIGVNAEKTLGRCIESVLKSRYAKGRIYVYYVDGGSTDRSIEVARRFSGVKVIEIHPEYPSPGIGRNAGWKAGSSPLVQFLDSDTILDPDWIGKAVEAMNGSVGAVRGNREEINPDASVFNWIGNLEWNAPPGECDAFGGDVLIRRSILEETGGYDEILVGGEDPELSQRIRLKGWKIIQLNEPMTKHDLAMTRFGQYWKRSYRTGYGFAAVTTRFGLASKGFWIHEFVRIIIRGGGFLSLTLLGLLGAFWNTISLALLIPAFLLLFFPRIFRLSYFMRDKNLPEDQAKIYALHCSFIVLPEFLGLVRFFIGHLTGRPLRNKRVALRTDVSKTRSSEWRDGESNTGEASMKNRPKIAYLASEYPGISHTFIFREIQSLRELGFDVKTASIRRPEHLQKMTEVEKKDAAETLYIKDTSLSNVAIAHLAVLFRSPKKYFFALKEGIILSRTGPRNIFKGLAYFAEAGILLHWMHRNQVGHVHVHFGNPAATVAMIAAGYGTVTFSMSIHGPDVFYNVDQNLLAEKVKRASAIRCISYYCQSQLMRLVPHRLWARFRIIRCGIDPDVFLPRPEPNNDVPEILCLGRLVPAKGQHILMEACGILKKRGVKYHLTVVGGGPDRDSLEALARQLGIDQSVTFTGAVGQDEVHRYYDRADIFVLASFAEGVPVVLMEAMAKEIVSVSTRITGIPELIEDGQDGVLVAPSDVEGLADRLQELLADGDLRRRFGEKGRQKVLEMYDLNKNCRLMAEFFKNADV